MLAYCKTEFSASTCKSPFWRFFKDIFIVGEQDKEIINRLQTAYSDKYPDFPKLTQATIANIIGIDAKTLSKIVKAEKRALTIEQLIEMHNAFANSDNRRYRALAEVILHICNEAYATMFTKINKAAVIKAMESNNCIDLLDLSSTAIMTLLPNNALIDHLPTIFKPGCTTKQLTLVVADHDKTMINDLEQWAYGKEGNYFDQLKIKLFVTEIAPEAEQIGVYIDTSFYAFMPQEGYVQLSQQASDALLEQEQRLASEVPVWQLHRTPEARIIVRLLRDMSDLLSPEVIGFLHQKIDFYESRQDTVYDSSYNVWQELDDVVVAEIRVAFGDSMGDKIADQLEFHKLQQ